MKGNGRAHSALRRPSFLFRRTFNDQFGSPALRQFNLIGMDFRVHGSTRGEVWKGFKLEDLGDDVSRFIVSFLPSRSNVLSLVSNRLPLVPRPLSTFLPSTSSVFLSELQLVSKKAKQNRLPRTLSSSLTLLDASSH